jgi:hypothetical protein
MSKIQIFGSYGNFEIDAETGVPTGHSGIPQYNDITKFDVVEYREWAKKNSIKSSDHADILSIGFWYVEDGAAKYEEPDAEYRKLSVDGWPQPIIGTDALADLVRGT